MHGNLGKTTRSVDLKVPLKGQQCGSEGRTRRPGSQSYHFSQCDFGPPLLSEPVSSSEKDHGNS